MARVPVSTWGAQGKWLFAKSSERLATPKTNLYQRDSRFSEATDKLPLLLTYYHTLTNRDSVTLRWQIAQTDGKALYRHAFVAQPGRSWQRRGMGPLGRSSR
eukprot:Rmarinus@m.22938